ncbi:MAG: hypothetical protein IPL53_06550 [Ignavibacteria bacterium]|nr:hypothetical protein [Ignavibacteria bacterium]
MITIQAKDMTDEQWMSFAKADDALRKEIDPEQCEGKDKDWQVLKNDTLSGINFSDDSFSNFYYLFDGNKAAAYIDSFERRGKLYFLFNYSVKSINGSDLKVILEVIHDLMEERNKDEAYFFTFHERLYGPVLKAGIEVYDEMLNSRLLKKDVDFSKLEKIVKSNHAINYVLELFHEIPNEIYGRFVNYMNEVIIDSNIYHPKRKAIKEYTMKDLLERVEDIKNDSCPYYMYIMFDKENIVAHCSVFIDTDSKSNTHWIDHIGAGYTAVSRNYRGNNLSKYIKAKMYLKIQEDYPDFEYIMTDTFPWNKHMYRINEEFGFKPSQKGYTFRFTKEFLDNYLK